MTQHNIRCLNLIECVWAALTKQVANRRSLQRVTQTLRQGFFARQECDGESGRQRGRQTYCGSPQAYSFTQMPACLCCGSETTSGGRSEPQQNCPPPPPHPKLSHRGRCGESAYDSCNDGAVLMKQCGWSSADEAVRMKQWGEAVWMEQWGWSSLDGAVRMKQFGWSSEDEAVWMEQWGWSCLDRETREVNHNNESGLTSKSTLQSQHSELRG